MHYDSDGCRLFYDKRGTGPDVVLLHPTPVHHDFWIPVAAAGISSRYRLLIPDLRAHGESDCCDGVVTIERLAQDVLRMLDHAGGRRAIFIGCSIGSYTLYEIWRRAPERVAAFAFCCGKPQPDTEENRANRDRWIAGVKENGTDGFFRLMLDLLVGKPSAKNRPQMMGELRTMMDRMKPQEVIAVQEGLKQRPDSVETARSITVPSLVLAGALDQSSTPAEMKVLADAIPGSSFHLLAEMGHYAPYERPSEVGALLRRFCDEVTARAVAR